MSTTTYKVTKRYLRHGEHVVSFTALYADSCENCGKAIKEGQKAAIAISSEVKAEMTRAPYDTELQSVKYAFHNHSGMFCSVGCANE